MSHNTPPTPLLHATTHLYVHARLRRCTTIIVAKFQTIGASGIQSLTRAMESTRSSSWAKGGCRLLSEFFPQEFVRGAQVAKLKNPTTTGH